MLNIRKKKKEKSAKFPLRWLIINCIVIGIKLTGHSLLNSLNTTVSFILDKPGEVTGFIDGFLTKIPIIGFVSGFAHGLVTNLLNVIKELILWLPNVMGNTFDTLFTVVMLINFIYGVSKAMAQYNVERERINLVISDEHKDNIVYEEDAIIDCTPSQCNKEELTLQLEENIADYKYLEEDNAGDVYGNKLQEF